MSSLEKTVRAVLSCEKCLNYNIIIVRVECAKYCCYHPFDKKHRVCRRMGTNRSFFELRLSALKQDFQGRSFFELRLSALKQDFQGRSFFELRLSAL